MSTTRGTPNSSASNPYIAAVPLLPQMTLHLSPNWSLPQLCLGLPQNCLSPQLQSLRVHQGGSLGWSSDATFELVFSFFGILFSPCPILVIHFARAVYLVIDLLQAHSHLVIALLHARFYLYCPQKQLQFAL